jgi:hypothetical protein
VSRRAAAVLGEELGQVADDGEREGVCMGVAARVEYCPPALTRSGEEAGVCRCGQRRPEVGPAPPS